MLDNLNQAAVRLYVDEKGVSLVEYGIALLVAITIGVVGLTALGGAVIGKINAAEAEL